MMQKTFVQVGCTAMREPNGERLPSVPIYVEAGHLTKTGLTDLENEAIANISGFFVVKRKERELKRLIGVTENADTI